MVYLTIILLLGRFCFCSSSTTTNPHVATFSIFLNSHLSESKPAQVTMRLKLHGSFEALRDTVSSRGKSKPTTEPSEDSTPLSIEEFLGSPVKDKAASRKTSIKTQVKLEHANSVPEFGTKKDAKSAPPNGVERQISMGAEEINDSLSELQTRSSVIGNSVRGMSPSKSARKSDGSIGGGLMNWTRNTMKRGGSSMKASSSLFFKPGFFNTDQALQPTDDASMPDLGQDDQLLEALGDDETDSIEDAKSTSTRDSRASDNVAPSSTFQVTSVLETASSLPSSVTSDALEPTSTFQYSSPLATTHEDETEMPGRLSHTKPNITSTLSSSESLTTLNPNLARTSWVSAHSAHSLTEEGTPPTSRYSSRIRLDSTASASRTSASAPKRTERHQLGPFITTKKRRQHMMDSMDVDLFNALDVRVDGDQTVVLVDENGVEQGPIANCVHMEKLVKTMAVETVDGKTKIVSATLPELVQQLASEGANDAEYVSDFLTTYRYFAEPEDVARLLIMRYVEVGETAKEEDTATDFLSFLKSSAPTDKGPEWASFLQLRVLNVFKRWIDSHPADFDQSEDLYFLVSHFLSGFVKRDAKRAPFADSMLQNLEEKIGALRTPVMLHVATSEPLLFSTLRRTSADSTSEQRRRPSSTAPGLAHASSATGSNLTLDTIRSRRQSAAAVQLTSTGSVPDIRCHARSTSAPPTPTVATDLENNPLFSLPSLAEYDPDIVAQQLTLLEHTQFKRIRAPEFFFQGWNDRQFKELTAPNLVVLISWFNRVAYGVATEVVLGAKLKQRVTTLKRFIYIAQLCFRWNNFNTLYEIVAGLNLGPVTRLKKTWKALPKKYWDVWNQLNAVVSNESMYLVFIIGCSHCTQSLFLLTLGSYRTYRISLRTITAKSSTSPILPYLGVNLSDLTFAEDGNPTYLQPTSSTASLPIVNFTKFQLISHLVNSATQLQRGEYTFPIDETVQNFLRNDWLVLDDAELYEASKIVEPRLPSI